MRSAQLASGKPMTDVIHADPRGRPALRKIRLYGSLAKFIGRRTLQADISTAAEAVRFLVANFAGLEQHMADKHYTVITHTALTQDELHDPTSIDTIKIVPVVEGTGPVGRILAGAALIALSFIIPFGALLAPLVLGVGASLVLGGVSQLLTPVPRIDQGEDSITDTKESYNFSGIQQTSRAGTPVPLIYGKTLVGSVVISAGISDEIKTGNSEPEEMTVFPADIPAGIGSALYPFEGSNSPCGLSNLKSITWYKDGVKLVTINYNPGTNTYTYVAEPGQYMPAWLNATSATPGVLVVGIHGAGTYVAVTECLDGSQYGKAKVVGNTQPYAIDCGDMRYRFMVSNSASIFTVPAGAPPFVEQTDPTVNVVRGVDCDGNVTNSWGIISWNPITDPGITLSVIDLQVTYNNGVTWSTYIDYAVDAP